MEQFEPIESQAELLQKSEEWLHARIGKMTSSEHYRLIAECKRPMTQQEKDNRPKDSKATTIADPTLLADGAITYLEEIVGEILTGQSADNDYNSKEMEWGVLHEPMARRLYEFVKGVKVQEVGIRELNRYVAGSPDGLVNTDGGIEIKCPYTNSGHVKNLRLTDWSDVKTNRKEHYWQCLSGMIINKRKWWDYVSFSPNFEGALQIKIIRIHEEDVKEDLRLLQIKLKFAVIKLEEMLTEIDLLQAS